MSMKRYLAYWGKAQPLTGWKQTWHPVAYHCLDVAAVAERLLADRPDLLVRISDRLGIPWDDLAASVTWLMAIHDVGKFADIFQWPFPEKYVDLGNPCSQPSGAWVRHTNLLHAMLRHGGGNLDPTSWPLFSGWDATDALDVLKPISGHHGQPPLESHRDAPVRNGVDVEDVRVEGRYLSAPARQDIDEFMADLAGILPTRPWPRLDQEGRAALSLALSGFAVLCDWLGSGKEWFAYETPDHDLRRYWFDMARPRADLAVRAAGITRTRTSRATGLASVFPKISSPRPMQAVADSLEIPAGPCMVVVEDITGSGKTEAALVLAHRMIAAGRGDGIFLGLPTMATSDAMYARVTEAAATMYPEDAKPEIVLSHGGSSRKRRASLDARHEERDGDGSVAEYVESWLASDSRSCLLADLGVGTIDQALLAILPARYQGLRLYGLAGKVLVLDEVHSYDRFMFEEIKALLRFHAFLGGSAIVMSATLTTDDRRDLAEAFRDGLRKEISNPRPMGRGRSAPTLPPLAPMSELYPAIHVVAAEGLTSKGVDAFKDLCRKVSVTITDAWKVADAEVLACLAAGGCACVVRSTVDEAIETHDRLLASGLSPTLLHARFAPADRASVQDAVVSRFGPKAPWTGRAGGLVVSTQVIEQSLDLDFDLLVTDIAPVELIVQRAGRVARHVERRKLNGAPHDDARLVVVTPDPDDVRGPDWLDSLVDGAGIIYRDHGRLWSAASALKRDGGFVVPEGVRTLVEECSRCDGLPEPLRHQTARAGNKELKLTGIGQHAVLNPRRGYTATAQWTDDTRYQTRIGDERRSIRLGMLSGGRLLPINGTWQDSSVDVAAARAGSALNPPSLERAIQTAMTKWSRHDREALLVVCEPAGPGRWTGKVVDGKGRPRPVHYDRRRGLEWRKAVP